MGKCITLLHDRKVHTEALNPMRLITECAGGREHFTPPDAIMNAGNSWSY